MKKEPFHLTVEELTTRGKDDIPFEVTSNKHLVYSSPATLSYNAPGAQGFGVKRAGLTLPESIMLVVAPGCCGRSTTILGDEGGYSQRIFHLTMSENDLVTGAHLTSIPQAIKEIIEILDKKPKAVEICITCVDALLGTDLERVCRKATKEVGIPVIPTYMYALLREGKNVPMVDIRKSLYSLIKPTKKDLHQVNLLGFFTHLTDNCELYTLLAQIGLTTKEIGRCTTFEEYQTMGCANFNLILDKESRKAAAMMDKKFNIPYAELTRLYERDKIEHQYKLFAAALGTTFDDTSFKKEADDAITAIRKISHNVTLSIGSVVNANPFELALSLMEYGFTIKTIFSEPDKDDYTYIERIGERDPKVIVYPPLSPSMINFTTGEEVDFTIGLDTSYYYPETPNLAWNQEIQPFGYTGLRDFLQALRTLIEGRNA